jgi:hypothetical protein
MINSNHQNSKHGDVPNIMWTCQLCIREDQNASKKKQKDNLFWIHVYINLLIDGGITGKKLMVVSQVRS